MREAGDPDAFPKPRIVSTARLRRSLRAAGSAALLILALGSSTGCTAGADKPNAPENAPHETPNDRNSMNTLILSLVTPGTEWVAATPFPVTLEIENRSETPLAVPSVDSPRPFVFVAKRLDEGGGQRELSLRGAIRARRPDVPPLPLEMDELAPGAKIDYMVDLAAFAVPPLATGRYQITAVWSHNGRRMESAPVAVTVLPPRITQMAVVEGASQGTMAMLFAHMLPGRKSKLFQYESRPSRPGDGVAFDRAVLEGTAVDGVAIAAELYANRGVRWYAWLREGMIAGGVAERKTVFREVPPVGVGFERAALQGAGWQFDHETSIFALMEQAEGQAVKVALVRFSRGVAEGNVHLFPLEGLERPLAWAVRLPTPQSPDTFECVVSVRDQEGFKIISRSLSLADHRTGPPKILAEIRGEFLAMACPEIGGEEREFLSVLSRADADSKEIALNRISLAGGEGMEWTIPLPKSSAEGNERVVWTLPSRGIENPPVFALIGGRLSFHRAGTDSDWREWPGELRNVRNLFLQIVAGKPFLVWPDPRMGVQVVAVPD